MQMTRLGLLVALGTGLGASAWDITAYADDSTCNTSNEAKNYRIFLGSDGECYNFGEASAQGATCQDYTEGGLVGPEDCGNTLFSAESVLQIGGQCTIYEEEDCESSMEVVEILGGNDGCLTSSNGPVKSFRC
ncbi:MAG: hypothetical protein LQ346_003976 [Caloplaca aetnensis]|nr:MAG: hypothetical protein LQ346_003976 [Caloplaca aetnensis]